MPFDCAQNGFTPFRPRVLRFYECIPNILIEVGFGPELSSLPPNTQRLSTVGSGSEPFRCTAQSHGSASPALK